MATETQPDGAASEKITAEAQSAPRSILCVLRASAVGLFSTKPRSSGGVPLLAFALVLVAGLFLRWPIASHDVEHYPGPDEGEVVENVLEMMKTGDFDHRHRGYPGLHFYLQMIPAAFHLLQATARGEGDSIAELPRTGFYLNARRLTLLAGLVTAVVVFFVARRWLTGWGAALAGSLVVLSPLFFRESAVVSPDLMLSLFVSLSLLLSLRLLLERSRGSFLAAGIAVGLAAAIKYTGVFAVAGYVLGWLLGAEPRRFTSRALAGLGAGGAAFGLASPYTLIELPAFVAGLSMHIGYYRASEMNAAAELVRVLLTRGLGVVAGLAAIAALVRAVRVLDSKLLVVLSFPVSYLIVFSFFDRAFPRHALALVPGLALASADAACGVWGRLARSGLGSTWLGITIGSIWLLQPIAGTVDLALRSRRPTPAERAGRWVEAHVPPGSRILQDQYTPRLDPSRFRTHRLRVDERRFVGNYDWVLYSGYPPGLSVRGLREVARFDNEDALGDTVFVYQVPDRETLMGVSLAEGELHCELGAGELPYFGDGWYPPRAGAFETSRLSRGPSSEIFFVLPRRSEPPRLEAELVAGAPRPGFSPAMSIVLNGETVASLDLTADERNRYRIVLEAPPLTDGLNRLELRHKRLTRIDRRHRDTAIRVYRLELRRVEGDQSLLKSSPSSLNSRR